MDEPSAAAAMSSSVQMLRAATHKSAFVYSLPMGCGPRRCKKEDEVTQSNVSFTPRYDLLE